MISLIEETIQCIPKIPVFAHQEKFVDCIWRLMDNTSNLSGPENISARTERVFRCVQDKLDVGFCIFKTYAMERPWDDTDKVEVVSIELFMIHKDLQGKGYGSKAFAAIVDHFKELHIMTLEVHCDNYIARRMYKKYGFKSISARGDFIIMQRRPIVGSVEV